jgi:hypothetical protein
VDIKQTLEALALVIAVAGLFVALSSLLQNLERARRELASALIYNWANHLDWPTSRALALLHRIDDTVIGTIDDKLPATLSGELYDTVVSALAAEFSTRELPRRPETAAGAFTITAEQSAHIRFLWIRWLNRLEGTLTAWQQGAASAEIMKAEFEPLVKGKKAELDALRQVRYGLPVIDAFCADVKNGRLDVRPKLGIFPWRA